MAASESYFGALAEQNTCGGTNGGILGSASTCILWLVAGIIIGSLSFEKKRRES